MSAPIVLEPPVALTAAERVRAVAAVGVARLVLAGTRARPARVGAILRVLRLGTHPVDTESAARARASVVTVSLRCASDHGCLLRSVAIVIAARLAGGSVMWRVGAASPPPALHAWVEAGGVPVGEPFDPRLLYRPLITI
ncbi:lasso peptide biosynthesis B2 protein [Amycolatopsis cihanbeyliensis]|uniref:Transglutaminase superfamily protein n=1 Tax=Amycolatopsis cihanbeyliensis TaxID=1128664 RepID=A0A542DDW3_AMYCI|nr:lasso peptide biosynthesis B2 protein [Amycolatopsis cihanbeyliensis]TQJ01268.1 transglutaminase superfamily protein [Amycolatopsis cihanbeyliensis]